MMHLTTSTVVRHTARLTRGRLAGGRVLLQHVRARQRVLSLATELIGVADM